VPSSGPPFSAALKQTVGAPLRPGHKVVLLPNGRIFPALLDAIEKARHSIHIEMEDPRVAEELEREFEEDAEKSEVQR
jgi:hypothetical protein